MNKPSRAKRNPRSPSKAKRPAVLEPDEKAKVVTQSARFSPEQMSIIEDACKAKQWSISQFLLVAAVEKAVAIKNLEEGRRDITWDAKKLARVLHGEIPHITYLNQEIGNPDDPYAGWEEHELTGNVTFVIVDSSGPNAVYAEYDDRARAISIFRVNPEATCEDDVGILVCKIVPRAVPSDWVGILFEELEALGTEMVPLIREAYNDFHLRRDRVAERRQLTNPRHLLDGQK